MSSLTKHLALGATLAVLIGCSTPKQNNASMNDADHLNFIKGYQKGYAQGAEDAYNKAFGYIESYIQTNRIRINQELQKTQEMRQWLEEKLEEQKRYK